MPQFWFLFIFGIAGIIGTVISSRTVDKHRSGTLVIPMLDHDGLCRTADGYLFAFRCSGHTRNFLGRFDDGDLDGVSDSALGYGPRCCRRGDIDVFRHFQYRYWRRSFIGSRVSAEFGFAAVPYVACALIGVCVLACAAIWLKRGSAILRLAKTNIRIPHK